MIKKVQRRKFLSGFPDFPQANNRTDEFIFPDTFAGYVLTLPTVSAKGHAKLLSVELTKMLILLNYKSIGFLGDTPTPWLYQRNTAGQVKDALQYLTDNEVTERFSGALVINDIRELPEFIRHLFWLVRYNAALPCFNFTDEYYNIVGCLCQYGNLHINTLNENTDAAFKHALSKTQFKVLEDGNCYERFSKSGVIASRQIVH